MAQEAATHHRKTVIKFAFGKNLFRKNASGINKKRFESQALRSLIYTMSRTDFERKKSPDSLGADFGFSMSGLATKTKKANASM
jgi:hypothetical protein